MNNNQGSGGPWFGGGRRRSAWLLPLVIGVGLGALLFGLLPNLGTAGGRHTRDTDSAGAAASSRREQAPASDAAAQSENGERRHGGRGHGRDHHGFGGWGLGSLFFPFGGGRLLLPLLLIGAGLWLLSGRRMGDGGQGMGDGGKDDPKPPVTGETRRL